MGDGYFKKRKNKKDNIVSSQLVIDSQTGEILTETIKHQKEIEPDFVKVYVDDVGKILGLTDCERRAVIQMACSMGYNGIIPLYGPMKTYMMKQLGINNVSLFDRRIKTLKDEGFLLPVVNPETGRPTRGMYCMNPNYFAKGTWDNIKKMRLTLEYSGEGRFMTTEIVTNDDVTVTNKRKKLNEYSSNQE
ncbi:MAG: replication/maintenance protein RepL [Bacteroidales bacterium]|nr:replication/maintenance protein RepL [Bacteroidales bacterium]